MHLTVSFEWLFWAIKNMHDEVMTNMGTWGGIADNFPITTRMHQESTLSLSIFILVLDVLTELIQESVPQYMDFANDILLIGESRQEIDGS